ncbi:MAG: ABC transporter permease [bacterium]
MMESILRDLRFGLRSLAKHPTVTVAALAALAVGTGAVTAVFSVANAVVFRPLPFEEPERLVAIWNDLPKLSPTGIPASEPELLDYQAQETVWEGVAAYLTLSATLTGVEEADRIDAAMVSSNFFEVLGVPPVLGRGFALEEGRPGNDQVAVVSQGLRQRHFGSDADLVGEVLLLNGQSYQVVGIAPEGFGFPEESDVWVPLAIDPADPGPRGNHYLTLFGRLKHGISLGRAQTWMETVADRLRQDEPEFYPPDSGFDIDLRPLHLDLVGDLRPSLLILLGTATFVMLMACTNVANLLLAWIRSRQLEFSVRLAMGAQRSHLVRQLLVESLLLSLGGVALGLMLAFWSLNGLFEPFLAEMPRGQEIGVDFAVLLFTIVLAVSTALLYGLFPALRASRMQLANTFRDIGGGSTGGRRHHLIQDSLVIAQVAFALVLLAGAGLMIRSLLRLQDVTPGFQPDNAVTARISLPRSQYGEDHEVRNFFDRQLEVISKLPGVTAVGGTNYLPLTGQLLNGAFTPEGHGLSPGGLPYDANRYRVTPGYFRAMQIPLIEGRVFDERDRTGNTAVVDMRLAKRFWPGESAVGRQIKAGDPESESPWLTIVGVVGHVIDEDLEEPVNRSQLYLFAGREPARSMYLVVRTAGDPEAVISGIKDSVHSADRNLPVYDVMTWQARLDRVTTRQRFSTLLMIVFGTVGLILAAVGVYGTMSYAVSQRNREIGIRLALGSARREILSLVLSRGLKLTGLGLALGLLLAFWLSQALAGLLYEVEVTDLGTVLSVVGILFLVAFVANLVPAHRATRIDPLSTLKTE